jgi:thymidylate synthase ThyX
MKVTQVAIRATELSDSLGRPALTPELLAAVGARYSRNNEGLNAILSRIDSANLDASVDSIFKMIDYGHQSIADMTPVAMFIDGISILLAYLVWSWCPTAGGQESSTRYIKLGRDGLVEPALFGVPQSQYTEWYDFIDRSFDAYGCALRFWEKVAQADPRRTRIPSDLLADPSDRARRQVARMLRNYAFDRARYYLPVAAKTNLMLVMSARGWVQLCQQLLSHWLPESIHLGACIRDELRIAAPRMLRHAEAKASFQSGHSAELANLATLSRSLIEPTREAACVPQIDLCSPAGVSEDELVDSLRWHANRYDFIGPAACRTSVRFSLSAVSIGEIRDLNRHRTGQKFCPLAPLGFYCAADQMPEVASFDDALARVGIESVGVARRLLGEASPHFVAWLLLGAQFRFEHTTTLDKFVYEAELRTGPGAHFRYADHLRDTVALLRYSHPRLAEAIRLGLSEPE